MFFIIDAIREAKSCSFISTQIAFSPVRSLVRIIPNQNSKLAMIAFNNIILDGNLKAIIAYFEF